MTTTTTQIPKLLLNRSEMAKALGISERTLWTLTDNGTIPAIKLGRQIRYRVSQIEAALDKLQSGSTDESTVG